MTHENCGVLEPEKHGAVTPDSKLPRFDPDKPRRKLLITIEVPEDFERRLDMQWVIEREIHADRWSWNWPPEPLPLASIADALLALDRIATRVAEAPDGYLECVNIARRVLREFPTAAWGTAMAALRPSENYLHKEKP